MCLPCRKTIRKYISNYNSGFGFNNKTFEIIAQKIKNTEPYLRHGGLIIDEMKLTEKLQAKNCSQIEGFVDIGPYTPTSMKSTPSNHGLVILFQPLVGKWSQIIGVFATSNNVSGDLLCKLIIEATVLSENAGLFVDFITCDAASWNRNMWKKFEISASLNYINNKMCHPVDISRYLYFISDFPHLVKCLRNMFISKGYLLPEGEARPEHIKAAWMKDSCNSSLKSMPKISPSHLNPNNFEKMRVSYAFQLFSLDVEKGLYLYKKEIEQQYGNSETTAKFVNKIRTLIQVMTSRHPKNSLYLESDKWEILVNFLKYLDEWETVALLKNNEGFLSQSTASGFRVTIKSTLDLLEFLSETVGFKYLMTSRLSQDTIENIFGIVRQSSGCNDHPTPYEFLITIQCLSFYNLAKPIKGGNCEQEIINSLISCDDMEPDTRLLKKVDEIFTKNDSVRDNLARSTDSNILAQHTPESELLVFFSGYVMRRCVFKMNCENCNSYCLSSAENNEFDNSYISNFDKGGLLYPSKIVVNMLHQLEAIINEYFTSETLHRDSILDILELIKEAGMHYIGCTEHNHVLTTNVVKFYLVCRLDFYIKGCNKSNNSNHEKMKYLKLHRLK